MSDEFKRAYENRDFLGMYHARKEAEDEAIQLARAELAARRQEARDAADTVIQERRAAKARVARLRDKIKSDINADDGDFE